MTSPEKKPTQRRKRPGGRLQIRDVARLAGVSAITVSRYINNPGKVAKDTGEKIASAIKESGYIPNMVAKGLSSNRTNVVAAIIPTITNSIFADLVSGLSDGLEDNGHRLLIAESGYSLEREMELIQTMIAQRPAGLVVTGQVHTEHGAELLRSIDIPVLETFETGAEPIDMCAGFSNFDASFQMVKGLIEAGYRKIGFVSAPIASNDRATRRREGYFAAMKEAGLNVVPGWVRDAKFAFREGARALGELVEQHPELEAIFFASDVLSIGGVMECQRRKIRFPEDVGICGFDDFELTAMTNPPLTTVRIPRYEIGHKAAAMLMARLNGDETVERSVDLGFEIVWRGSTRLPPQ
ncbi:LacI family DNA-binding transcriptional regulator [Pelagibius sp. Alg239-R121]|uniref:LacI family DNA-binding transcriptional regulator n=1 Tax=Pelagibius sp. Alg239-R121 TaxID=2993448 RepID=UPI0024A69280|nr:LacI family DNA-binding transcriptional regulator [Pelagibius sp. Alg239-R121]